MTRELSGKDTRVPEQKRMQAISSQRLGFWHRVPQRVCTDIARGNRERDYDESAFARWGSRLVAEVFFRVLLAGLCVQTTTR